MDSPSASNCLFRNPCTADLPLFASLMTRVPHSIGIPSYTLSILSIREQAVKMPVQINLKVSSIGQHCVPRKRRALRRERGLSRGSSTGPVRRCEFPGIGGGVIPLYRRSHGEVSCTQDDFVAEIRANGAAC